MFGVTILGNNSAVPAYNRHPTSQVVTIQDQLILVDCGEGTQMQLAKYKIRRGKIKHILISHLHGDHYFGLIGIITSMSLLGREDTLFVHGPAKLKTIISLQLEAAGIVLPFHLDFKTILTDGLIVDEPKYTVECFSTQHRIECRGFLIREKKQPRKINIQKALQFPVPTSFYDRLKMGEDYLAENGVLVKNEWVTMPNVKAKSYAYSSDTFYDTRLISVFKGVDVLYHETTYLKDMAELAQKRFHSTTHQAAMIAKGAGVGRLLIGHFSSRYEDLEVFANEAREIFQNTSLALEGVTYRVV